MRRDFVFLMNFNAEIVSVELSGMAYTDMLTGQMVEGEIELAPYGVRVLST